MALRNPCAEQCGSPAALHCSLNQFPKPDAVNGFPNSVTRKVIFVRGLAASTCTNSGCIGISSKRRPQEVRDQRLTNDMGESNTNIRTRTTRKKPNNGGGRSPDRTRLQLEFPANREKYREFCGIRPSTSISMPSQRAKINRFHLNSLRNGTGKAVSGSFPNGNRE